LAKAETDLQESEQRTADAVKKKKDLEEQSAEKDKVQTKGKQDFEDQLDAVKNRNKQQQETIKSFEEKNKELEIA